MSDPIKLIITAAGLEAALNVELTGIVIKLDKVKFSTDLFESVVNDPHTDLANVVAESSIVAGGTSASQNTLRFTTMVNTNAEHTIGSLGLYTDDDVLFAIASVDTGYLMKLYPRVSFVMAFGMSLSTYLLENITVVIDGEASIAAAMIFQHEDHGDPHPQYLLKSQTDNVFSNGAQRIFPVDKCIITYDPTYNPAVALSEFLGENTKWRKLPFVLQGVSVASEIGKISFIGGDAENVATLGVIIWQRMPDNWVQPTAMIYYAKSNYHASPQAHFGLLSTIYGQFGFNDSCLVGSYYVIKMTAANDIPTRYKLVSKGKIVDAVFKDATGLLHVDEDGFGLIPVRRKLLSAPVYGLDPTKIELVLLGRYQHVCSQSDQKYRFLDDVTQPDAVAEISVDASKKYLRSNEVIEFNIVRTETAVETLYLAFIHLALSSGNSIAKDRLGAVGYFYLQESSSAGVALEDAVGGTGDDIYRLDFAENETEKKVVLVLRDVSILKRMNVAACVSDISSASFLDSVFFDNFLIEKNTVQANYMLTYTILGTTLTISLDTTLVAENTIVEWNISNFTGDPIAPSDTTGEFTIDEDGHAEVAFTFNLGDEFSFEFGLTGRDEYVGVEKS